MKITKKTTIGQAICSSPKAMQILAEYNFHCVGCPCAQMETIEQGFKAHGLNDKAIALIVKKLNDVVEK